MAASPFKHTPLIDNETYFRLLKIRTGDEAAGEKIACDVQSFPLATCPSFEAPSYTWGNPLPADQVEMDSSGELFPSDEEFQARSVDWSSEVHEILCNGSEVRMSLNLFELLTHLKSLGVVDFIWIDRICTNLDRTGMKDVRKLRLGPQFCEVYDLKIYRARFGKT